MDTLKNKIVNFPKTPGVYEFCNKKGKILYIGKATSLKDRVGSYFLKNAHLDRPQIELMMPEITDVTVRKTDTVLEALILEANLIKKHQPKFNVREKDDKSFVYIVITKEEFPRVFTAFKTQLARFESKKIFGPYTSKHQMETALKIIRRIFPFHSSRQVTSQCCFDHQIGRCPGPHSGAINRRGYLKNIHGIEMILEGKKKGLLAELKKQMKAHAKENKFEKAAEVRNRIFALQHIQDVALISDEGSTFVRTKVEPSMRIEAYDISNIGGDWAVGSMVVFEGKQPMKDEYRKFKIKSVSGIDDIAMMQEVLARRFRNNWTKPDLILLDGGKGHLNMAQQVLADAKLEIPIMAVAKGPTRKKLDIFQSKLLHRKLGDRMFAVKLKGIAGNEKLLARIRDEAHRFAITYHKNLRIRSWKNN